MIDAELKARLVKTGLKTPMTKTELKTSIRAILNSDEVDDAMQAGDLIEALLDSDDRAGAAQAATASK
jgi:hypothetical protein